MARDAYYLPGQIVPGTDLRIVRLLGAGGMGAVYEVEETSVEAPFVMKVVHPRLLASGNRVGERMRIEAKTLARLNHKNIVRVYRAGITAETPPLPYYVMDRLDGYTVRHVLRWHRTKGLYVPISWVFWIQSGLLSALEHAHRSGVVHRDVKPENLFVHQPEGHRPVLKLLDFGIMAALSDLSDETRMTQGGFAGTYTHAAPEQLRGAVPAPAMGIYAAGVVPFELLSGAHPFESHHTPQAMMRGHMVDPPPPLPKSRLVHPKLEGLVREMLAKDPARRPPSARLVLERLAQIKGEWMQQTSETFDGDPVEFAFDVDWGQRWCTNAGEDGGFSIGGTAWSSGGSGVNHLPANIAELADVRPFELRGERNDLSKPFVATRAAPGQTVETRRLPLPGTMALAFVGGALLVGAAAVARKAWFAGRRVDRVDPPAASAVAAPRPTDSGLPMVTASARTAVSAVRAGATPAPLAATAHIELPPAFAADRAAGGALALPAAAPPIPEVMPVRSPRLRGSPPSLRRPTNSSPARRRTLPASSSPLPPVSAPPENPPLEPVSPVEPLATDLPPAEPPSSQQDLMRP